MERKQEISEPKRIELLAPARDAATAFQAVLHGADAVYMGAPSHGARHQAANSIDDLRRVADFAHAYGARLYVTVNTLVYDDEIPLVEALVWDLYRAGVDALIVQDLGLLRMNLPPIALHASTQCDTRDPAKARFLQDAGFSQIVLARELSLDEIRSVAGAVDVPLEVFVHGALCVSYSGDCQASHMLTGRSANRGECAQVCRFPFDLEDASGRKLLRDKHLLSLRDMNRSAMLADLLDAGATSFKIEGRLKDAAYVKNVVAAYRCALDEIIDADPARYRRSSLGRVELGFTPDLSKSFNRGYTSYFLTDPGAPGKMATFGSPKWIGEEVGKVLAGSGRRYNARLKTGVTLNNGDGLGYFDETGTFRGFRLNRADNGVLFTATPVDIPSGALLYRNSDAARARLMAGETATRRIALNVRLRTSGNRLVLDLEDEAGLRVSSAADFEPQPARTPQLESRRRILMKLGGTRYSLAAEDIVDEAGEVFVPASVLTALRREAVAALDTARIARHQCEPRREPAAELRWPGDAPLTRHDNVANSFARGFYAGLGIEVGAMAAEVERPAPDTPDGEVCVMETRYCLRRELGACLKQGGASKLPAPLYLTSSGNRFRLDFDCARCRMRVFLSR